jgi:cytochrome c peroxidase
MFPSSLRKDNSDFGPKRNTRKWLAAGIVALAILVFSATIFAGSNLPNPLITLDPSGLLSTYSTAGGVDVTNPFFQSLGTNGRSCVSCHQPADAWTVTPAHIQARFYASGGDDPIFRPVDGANCPSADVSTFRARKAAYSLLLKKGLIRVSLPVPSGADFTIQNIQDPYNCPETTPSQPALYRRPLPSTNLDFLATVMWDGRETVKGQALTADLAQQAIDATLGHAQASTSPSAEQVSQIVSFETALYTAQVQDVKAGNLKAGGATGGPENLSTQPFYLGINDALGQDPNGTPFNPVVFTPYAAWEHATGNRAAARQSVARGEALFNMFPITITRVAGLNDLPGLEKINGTCTTCHDTPNAGNHSLSLAINIGTTDYPALPALDVSGLPVYNVVCADGSHLQVTDIGRAMITAKCADVGKLKGPILRGLAARAPYFHNGAAKTLMDAVEFYNERFALNLSTQQKQDLVAFLKTL